jgi:hypothetical protein
MPGIDSFTKLCLHCDGTNGSTSFTDASASAHTVTVGGNAQVVTAQGKFSQGVALDGTGDYLALDGSSDFAFGTGDFTVDFWVKWASIPNPAHMYDARAAGVVGANLVIYGWYADGHVHVANGTSDIAGTTNLNDAAWHHVAATRAGTTLRLFIDGVQEATTSDSVTYVNPAGRPWFGGKSYGSDGGVESVVGWMDEIRVSKGIARWTSNFTPPSAPYDTTGTGNVYTKAGYATAGGIGAGPSASITQETGFATAGGVGAGPSASVFVEAGRATAGGVGAGPWQRIRTRTGYATAGGIGAGPSASVFVETGFATAGTVGSGASQKTAASGGTIYPKAGFATVGGVGSGPSESIFQESGWASAGTVGSGFAQKTAAPVISTKSGYATIGGFGSGAATAFSPTFGIDAFTVLCLHCDGPNASTTFIDSSRYAHTVSANGDAQVDTSQPRFGSASALFDGAGDRLTTPDHTDFEFGSGDFTIDFWMQPAAGGPAVVVGKRGGTASFGPYVFYLSGLGLGMYMSSTGTGWDVMAANPFGTLAINTWYHVAVSRSGNTFRGFLNGGLAWTLNSSVSLFDNSDALAIGANGDGTESFNGWLDEVRVSKGIARWTASFTPPSGPYTLAPAVLSKSGWSTVAGLGAGSSASIFVERGSAILTGAGRGLSASIFVEGGYGTLAGKGSGAKRMPGHDLILIPEDTDTNMALVPSLTGHF